MSEQDINIDDFKFERIGGFIPTREEAKYALGNFFKALDQKFGIVDPSVRSGDATYYDIAESFTGKPTYRNEAFDTGSRDTGFGLADITPVGALYMLDEAINQLPDEVKNNPVAMMDIMSRPIGTTIEKFDMQKFMDNAPIDKDYYGLLPIDIFSSGVGSTGFAPALGALGRQTARAIAKEIKPVTDAVKFLRRQANKKPPSFDDMTKAKSTGKPVFSSDEEFVSPTKEADLSKAKPEFMSAKPEPTLAMSGINRVFHKGQFVSGKDFSPDVVIPFSNVVDETANLMKQQGYSLNPESYNFSKNFTDREMFQFKRQDDFNRILVNQEKNQSPKKNLIIHHNINQVDLIKADKLGGIPVPSIAISNIDNPMSGFGDVVLIGSKDMAKPSSGNPVYKADAYTVRMPRSDITVNKQVQDFTKNEIDRFFRKFNTPNKIKKFLAKQNQANKFLDEVHKFKTPSKRKEITRNIYDNFKEYIDALQIRLKDNQFSMNPTPEALDMARGFQDRATNKIAKMMYLSDQNLVSDEEILEGLYESMLGMQRSYRDAEDKLDGYDYLFKDENDYYKGVKMDTTFGGQFDDELNSTDVQGLLYISTYKPIRGLGSRYGFFPDYNEFDVDPTYVKPDSSYEKWLIDKRNKILEVGGEVNDRIFVEFTPNGRKYLPATLNNFVKIMKKQRGAGKESITLHGMGDIRAKLTPEFRTLSEIQAERGRIVTSEEFEDAKNELQLIYDDISDEVSDIALSIDKDVHLRTVEALFEDLLLGKLGTHDYSKNFDSRLLNNKDLQTKVKEFREKVVKLPTEYFEVKPQRGVRLDEFVGAIVPEDVSPQTLAILEKNGIRVEKYSYDDSFGDDPTLDVNSASGIGDESIISEYTAPTKKNLFRRFPEFMFSIGAGVTILPEIQRRNSLKMQEPPLS